jgi:hypothetical protein
MIDHLKQLAGIAPKPPLLEGKGRKRTGQKSYASHLNNEADKHVLNQLKPGGSWTSANDLGWGWLRAQSELRVAIARLEDQGVIETRWGGAQIGQQVRRIK